MLPGTRTHDTAQLTCLRFVPDLDPFYVVAIVDTAPEHMVRPLRDAFSNHISLQTVMRVNIDVSAANRL